MIQRDIYNIYTSAKWKPSDPKMWVVKEVGGDTKTILAAWRMLMGFDSKIVMILRDPLMVVRSIIMDRRKKNIRIDTLGLLKETREAIRVLVNQLDYLDDQNTYFITYDRLTAAPEETMKGICGFLGIAYEDINAYPTIFGENVVVSTSSRPSNKVFKSGKKWIDDLSLREKLLVSLFYKLLFRPAKTATSEKARAITNFADAEKLVNG